MKELKGLENRNRYLLGVLAVAVFALFPVVCRVEHLLTIGVKILIMMIYASALNITNGYTGMFNLGVSSFMCVASYTAALLAKNVGLSFGFILPIACVTTALMGLLVVLPTMRLTGMFFSIVTLGIAETIRVIALNWNGLTNGPLGVSAIPFPVIFGVPFKTSTQFYYLALAFLLLVLFCINRIINSRVGTAWISIRENQEAASSLGINVAKYKVMNVMCSAFFCGIGGTLFAYYYRYIEPGNFAIDRGHEVLAMVVLGGMGTLAGPLTGSLLIILSTEVLRFASEYRMVFYGVLIILIMWFRPQGLVGASSSVLATKRAKSPRIRKTGQRISSGG